MRKWTVIWMSLLLALSSCMREEDNLISDDGPSEGPRVEVVFTLPAQEDPSTRALGENGSDTPLNTLHLAVFGSSGYLKEYVQAQPVELLGDKWEYIDLDHVSRSADQYAFRVSLTISDNPRTIHFIGNGPTSIPFGYAHAVVPSLLSEGGEGAYWQMISLPSISARKDSDGDYINGSGEKITDGTGYVADEATLACFQHIPLIRNWAKIVVTKNDSDGNDPYFEPISYAVVNVPSRGSVAPHSSATGFVSGYQNYSFTELENMGYGTNLPVGTVFSTDIPSAEDFVNGTGGVTLLSNPDHAVYLYERPVPSDDFPPSYVIVYGTYLNPDPAESEFYGKNYFYKIDLMEDARYYPVYRNFKYQILIHKIRSHGHYSPAAAVAAAGSADVSADINTRSLNDISDGEARLVIRPWMAQTFTSKQTDNTILHAFFMNDIIHETVDMDASSVKVELLPRSLGAEDIIEDLWIDAPEEDSEAGQLGWRTIHFSTKDPNQIKVISTQTIRITASYQSGLNTQRIYRDIDITIQPIQPMKVSCGYHSVPDQAGSPQTVTVSIPDGLVESMFPLQFQIEADALSLTPDDSVTGNNLPVEGGPSLSGSGKAAFHFVRTLSWSEYQSLPLSLDQDDFSWRSFTCYFKTNRSDSGSTVWVANDFFETAHDAFVTQSSESFPTLAFTTYIPREEGAKVTVAVEMRTESGHTYPADFPVIYMEVYGMTPTSDMVSYNGYTGKYAFKPREASFTLDFLTTTDDGDLQAVFEAEGYTTRTLKPYRFTDFGFVDGHVLQTQAINSSGEGYSVNSNVVLGRVNRDGGKYVLFRYHEDPQATGAEVWLKDLTGLQMFGPRDYPAVGLRNDNSISSTYRELDFQTPGKASSDPVSFTLCAVGYVEEDIFAKRFNGSFSSQDIGSNCSVFNGVTAVTSGSNVVCDISFSEISSFNTSWPQGIILNPGGTYTIHFNLQEEDSDRYLYYIQIRMRPNVYRDEVKRSVNLYPEEVTPSVGTFSQWENNNMDFVWNLPQGTREASLTIKSQDIVPTNIYHFNLKSFKGTLY